MASSSTPILKKPSVSIPVLLEKLSELSASLCAQVASIEKIFSPGSLVSLESQNNLRGQFNYLENSLTMLLIQHQFLVKKLKENKEKTLAIEPLHIALAKLLNELEAVAKATTDLEAESEYQLSLGSNAKYSKLQNEDSTESAKAFLVKHMAHLDRAASLGHLRAQVDISPQYILHQPDKKERGETFLNSALTRGYPLALHVKAQISWYLSTSEKDPNKKESLLEQARSFFLQAQKAGCPDAYVEWGDLFHSLYPKTRYPRADRAVYVPKVYEQAYNLAIEQKNNTVMESSSLKLFNYYYSLKQLEIAKTWALRGKHFNAAASCCVLEFARTDVPIRYINQSDYLFFLCKAIEHSGITAPIESELRRGLKGWNKDEAPIEVIYQVGIAMVLINRKQFSLPTQFLELISSPDAFCTYLDSDGNRTEKQKLKIIDCLPSQYKKDIKRYLKQRSKDLMIKFTAFSPLPKTSQSLVGSYLTLFVDDSQALASKKKAILAEMTQMEAMLKSLDSSDTELEDMGEILELSKTLKLKIQQVKEKAERNKLTKPGMTSDKPSTPTEGKEEKTFSSGLPGKPRDLTATPATKASTVPTGPTPTTITAPTAAASTTTATAAKALTAATATGSSTATTASSQASSSSSSSSSSSTKPRI